MLKIDITGLQAVKKQLEALSGHQQRAAAAEALNMVAGRVAKEVRKEMQSVFDRPTPYTLRSVQWKPATADRLFVEVAPTYYGGKGIDPQKFLAAQAEGGPRRNKRAEVALRRVQLLPDGMQMVIPQNPFPGSADAFGNLKGSFIVQLISYFQAFGEQGYRANMTQKRKDKIADKRVYSSLYNKRQYRAVMGHQFFVVNGNGQMKGVFDAKYRAAHLEPGIWARSSEHGSAGIVRIRPVVIFVKAGNYKKRLDMDAIAERAGAQELFTKWLRGRIREAARNAGATP